MARKTRLPTIEEHTAATADRDLCKAENCVGACRAFVEAHLGQQEHVLEHVTLRQEGVVQSLLGNLSRGLWYDMLQTGRPPWWHNGGVAADRQFGTKSSHTGGAQTLVIKHTQSTAAAAARHRQVISVSSAPGCAPGRSWSEA
jgi:hypothetical protein